MKITCNQAAKMLGVSAAAISKMKNKKPRPAFFVEHLDQIMVDINHPEWKAQEQKTKGRAIDNKHRSEGRRRGIEKQETPGVGELEEAAILGHIAASKIKQEKAKQEEIKTAELKKELAPMYLLKHFFSFSEKMIQRIYRKPHDIEPQLSALFLAKEPKRATQLIVREMESIIIDVQRELIAEVEAEGFKVDE
jgi:hypothetical protein